MMRGHQMNLVYCTIAHDSLPDPDIVSLYDNQSFKKFEFVTNVIEAQNERVHATDILTAP